MTLDGAFKTGLVVLFGAGFVVGFVLGMMLGASL